MPAVSRIPLESAQDRISGCCRMSYDFDYEYILDDEIIDRLL